jgi:hypothetical protein
MTYASRWTRPLESDEEQHANGCQHFANATVLSAVSEVPANQVRANFDALLPGKTVPLIWERTYDTDGNC